MTAQQIADVLDVDLNRLKENREAMTNFYASIRKGRAKGEAELRAALFNANGERRYKVNVKRCPVYAESLEQQVWDDKGEPDKKSGNDHPNDAGGYFIVKQFPIVKPTGRVTSLRI